MVNGNHTLLFYYDDSDSPTAFSYNGTLFLYIKNLQGDVEKIVNQNGNVIANYTYDAWGKPLSVTDSVGDPITSQTSIALLNPLRYRGYVYDNETGLYYLQSRYYDPTTCRFLNADTLIDTQSGTPPSTNMFAYCENSCLKHSDPQGYNAFWLQDFEALGVGHTSLLLQFKDGKWWYFYWGYMDIQLLCINKERLSDINKWLKGKNKWKYEFYSGKYNVSCLLKGDFTNSILYIKNSLLGRKNKKLSSISLSYLYQKENLGNYTNGKYHLVFRNCVQMCINALLKGGLKDAQYSFLKRTFFNRYPFPNNAYNILCQVGFFDRIYI